MAQVEQKTHGDCPSESRESLLREEDNGLVFTVFHIYTIQIAERKSFTKKLCSQEEEEDDV